MIREFHSSNCVSNSDVAAGLDSTSKTSDSAVSDANLMFEVLFRKAVC